MLSIFRDLAALLSHHFEIGAGGFPEGLTEGTFSSAILDENGQVQNFCFGDISGML